MQLIETATVGSGGAASIVFNSISQEFDDLVLVLSARTNNEPDINGYGVATLAFNGSTANLSNRRLLANGSSAQSLSGNDYFLLTSASTNTANTFGNSSLYLPNYRSSVAKTFSIDVVTESNETRAYQVIVAGLWNDTSALTSITLTAKGSGLFVQHSSASLYGILKGSDGTTVVS